jgi:carboxylate-amine ligase
LRHSRNLLAVAEEVLQEAYDLYESTQDFTVAVEEEFSILDPETLSLTNRFEDFKAAAQGTELEPHLVGELIASEVEVRTGRCESFAEIVTLVPERRAQLRRLADELGVALGATGTHPWSPWQEQRIIDTPHYRLRDELLRYVVWRNNSFGLHVHVAIRGADRAVKVADGLRTYLPELLAWSASSPFVENVNTGLHSARTEIFTRLFPRCGIPDVYGDWDTFADYVGMLYGTGSISDPTEMWWSVRPHLGFPTVEIRISDAQPIQEEAISLAALSYSLAARIARAVDEGEPLLVPAHRELEENFWRAIRWGLSGEMIDLRTRAVRPTRAAIEELIEWVQPVAAELGATDYLAIPEANAAERQIARFEEGASLEEVYAEQVRHSMEPVSG